MNGLNEHLTIPDLASYSTIIVAFSGGKDSLACVLHLLEQGVDPHRIELWHHDVDGREGSDLMDWPVTRSYCQRVALHLGLPLYFSWKVGGFEGEMLRQESPTAPTRFEAPGAIFSAGGKGPKGTRQLFPQASGDLKVRWCSAYLKIDICSTAIRNQRRFEHARTLVVSGERAEESPQRARYLPFEIDRSDRRAGAARRYVDRWRPVHAWKEEQVWEIIRRWRINPHPAYRIGWGRLSCAACIFGSPSQWASLRAIDPARVARIAAFEARFGKTIDRAKIDVAAKADKGKAYHAIAENPQAVHQALTQEWTEPVTVDDWRYPAGAFGESTGPS